MGKDTRLVNIYIKIHNKRTLTMDDLKYLVSKGINVYAQDVLGDPKSAIE